MTIGQRIKNTRKKAGMTQEELGAVLGVSGSMIAQYETDRRNPKLDNLKRIAAALGVEWMELVPEDKQGAAIAADVIKKAGLKLVTKKDGKTIHHGEVDLWDRMFPLPTPQERINAALEQLNPDGQQKAVERVEELTEIPKYQRPPAPESTPAPPEGKDTTPDEKPPEDP